MGKATDILNRRKKYGSTYVNAEYDTAKNSTAALDILNNRRIDKLKKELNSVDIKSLYEYKDFGLSEDKKKEYKTTLSNYKSALESLKKYDLSFSDDKYNKILQDIDLLSNKFDVLSNYKTESEFNDAVKLGELYNMSSADIEKQMGISNEEYESKLAPLEAEYDRLNNKIRLYNRGDRSKFSSSDAYNKARKRRDELKKQISNQKNKNDIAYTTSSGQNITWSSIYKKKKDEEDFNALYNEMSAMSDWAEHSKYKPTYDTSKGGRTPFNAGDNDYELANHFNVGVNGTYDPYYAYYTDEKEKELFNYLAHTKGTDYAVDWLMSREDIYKERRRKTGIENAQRFAKELPVLSDAIAVAGSLVSPFEYLGNALTGNIGERTMSADMSSAIKGTRMEQIDWEVGDWDVFDFLYGTTTSMAESTLAMATFGGLGGVSLGLNAAAQSTNDALDRGMSKGQAFTSGLASGIFEGVFETWSIGAFGDLTKNLKRADFRNIAKYVGKNMWNNAKEETLTEISNMAYDYLANGDFSQYETAIRQYMNTGMSEADAKLQVAKELGIQVAEAAGSGALMGFGFGAIGGAKVRHNITQSGKAIKDAGETRNLVELGKSLGEGTESFEAANKIGDKSRALAIGRLMEIVGEDIPNANKVDMIKAFEEKGYNTKEANLLVNKMTEQGLDSVANIRGMRSPAQTYNDVLSDPNSSISQRNEAYRGIEQNVKLNQLQRAIGKATKDKSAIASHKALTEEQGNLPTQEENPVESKFESNTEGKDFDTTSGKIIASKKLVSSAKDDMAFEVTYDDGTTETVDAKNISFGNDGEALVYSTVMDMNVPLGVAESLIGGYKGNDIKTAATYVNGIREAFTFGKYNQEADLNNGRYASQLTDEQRNSAFKLGRIYANEKAIADTVAIVGEAKPNAIKKREGKLHFEGDKLSLTSVQDVSIENLKVLTMAIGKDIHIFESYVDKNGKRVYKDANGNVKKAPNGFYDQKDGSIWIDLNAGNLGQGTMLYTVAHELTHFIKQWSPTKFKALADFLVEQYGKEGVSVHQLVLAQQKKAKENGRTISYDVAFEEMVADSMETMLTDGKVIRELVHRDKGLFDKIKSWIDNLLRRLNKEYKNYSPETKEGQMLREMKKTFEEAQRLFADALVDASDNFAIRGTDKAFVENYLKTKDVVYNLRAAESHQEKLAENYTSDASIDLETLQKRYAKVIGIWEKLGGELNSKFLNEWNNKVGKDRAFTIFKAQAGYKYNVELSSMCKKGVPLFEAIDTIVKKEVMNELKTKTLGKAEKEILYDILKNHNFEIPCAICYVEQARQREGVIINDFLDGKIEKNAKGKITKYKLGWNDVLNRVENEMKKNGVDYTFRNVDKSIATDNYAPADIVMDEATQDAFYKALKKVANAEIVRWNREERKSNQKERRQITDLKPQTIKEVFKGTLPSNLKIFKVLFNNPSSRFKISRDLLYSSATTLNLANTHNDLYSLFNSQGGVAGYKTKQAPIVYWGDILGKSWKPSTVRKEGGIRNQSNSDFQMYTLLDQAQMYIDFSAKGYYLQAYTKVLAELKLFGLSRGKINASLIPQVIEYKNADGSINWAKTMENAGLDENGNPIYDDFEGINHTEAFMLIEDAEYSKNICGICIGYSDNHIRKLLDDNRVQQIIGFHDKTDNPEKRYRGAKYSKNYNGLNEAVKVKADGTEETVHVGFNQFVSKAEKMFKFNKKTETFEGTVNHNGKEYSANDIPRLAADLYLEMCAEKNYRPAYNDFSSHKNYYKLLADFGLYDSQGNYAPHQKVQYNMPDKVPYLDKNGNKAYMSTEAYIKAELQKELTVRDSISEALADTSKNGIIPQFVERVNASHTEKADTKLHSDRDSEGNELSKEQQEFFRDSKVRDENGNLLVVYHGSPKGNTTIFDKSVTSKDNDMGQGIYFSTNISDANEYRRKNNVGDMGKIYRGKIYSAYVHIENPFVVSESEKISLTDALNLLKLCEDRITAKDVWYDLNINAKDGYVTTSQFANSNISTHMTDILAKSNKYDGIIDETVATKFELKEGTKHIIVLDSNQIKETTNTKPTTDPDIRHSSRIEADMSEEKRYEILKDKKIQPQEIEIDKDFDIEFSFLENNIKSIVEKPLISKLQELGYLKKYTSNAIDVEFEFTGSGVRKSIHSQENHYGGNLGDFAKVVLNMQKLLDNSVLLEIHADKGKGTPRENPQLIQTYVLLSAFREGNSIKPVQFEVKQYVDNDNRLYLAVALTKIETGVKGNTIPQNEASTSLLPVSEISIADLFKNVNIKDAKFLKYAPNQFLSEEQIKAKERELAIDREKYSIKESSRVTNTKLASMDDTALYIKNTKKANYIGMIFNGTKTEETRSRRTLDAFIGKDFYVTDGEKVYGKIVLGEPHKYTEEEFHKLENQKKHRVPKGDEYDVKPGGSKWAYPIESYERFNKPKKLSDSKEYMNSFQARQVLYSDRDQAPIFYSQMGKVVEGVKQEKLGANSVVNLLRGKGVKAEEIRWSGIVPFLEGKKSVTKQELLDFINGSMLQIGEQMSTDEENTRWSQYKLDGGTNYREIVFTMPNSSYSNGMMRVHWGEDAEGVLVHARIQDFDVDGKKMLFVEEIQSDWHNEGHKNGYESNQDAMQKKIADLEKQWYSLYYKMLELKKGQEQTDIIEKMDAIDEEKESLKKKVNYGTFVPDAPFKENYHEFVLKRLLRMAAEQGYDSIGWTPADIQSERWSDEFAEAYRIEYDQEMPKFLKKYGRQWGAKVDKTFLDDATQEKASYVIGTDTGNDGQYYPTIEEAVEVLIEDTNENFGTEFSAENVDIDEWEDVVRVFDEETGDEIGTLHIEYGTPDSRGSVEIWSMDITDSMKESVLYEGQVMYSERVTDKKTLDFLNEQMASGEVTKVYRAMQAQPVDENGNVITAAVMRVVSYSPLKVEAKTFGKNGKVAIYPAKLFSPMAGMVNGKWSKSIDLNVWEETTFDLAHATTVIDKKTGKPKIDNDKKNASYGETAYYYGLVKGGIDDDGKKLTDIPARYNPYIHTSLSALNDQFSSANKRPELVTVECIIPNSELTSGFRAEGAKDRVGAMNWHSGPTSSRLAKVGKARTVILTRYDMPVRVLPDSEVAKAVAKYIGDTENIAIQGSTVTPSLSRELMNLGISVLNEEQWSQYSKDFPAKTFGKKIGEVLYSERDDSSVSTRTLLANALEGAAQNDIEKNKLAQYKEKIALIEAEQKKLHELREKMFTKGINGDERRKIQDEATRTANRINTYDRQLFNLEATTALKNVLTREKELARKRQKQKDAENLREYKEKVAKTTRELLEKNRQSRERAIEGRNKTEMRHKVKKVVNDLNNLLLKPTKERHVPEEMRVAVAEALSIVNMDTVDAETRVARLNEKIAKANDPDIIASLTESRDRILEQGNKLGEKLKNLKEAYGMVRDSADNSLNSMYDDVIYNKIEIVQKKVGKTPLRNMTLEQLESVYELYKMVLTTVRDSNKAFAENITMTRQALGSNTFEEIKENNKAKDRIRFEGVKKFGWKYLKPMLAMKTIGSETLQKLWNNILYGQEVFAQDYDEAVKFAKETKEKYGYDKWDLLKQYSFESKSGKVMKINLEQMMSIYAYSKRKQADEHIEFGGILLNESIIKEKSKLGKIVEVKVNDSTAYRLDKMQVGEIIATLEKEFPGAKDFVDEMQKYLSETMGEKGNEVSMKMYGIKLFKEEHYFPLKSSKEFMEAANAKLKGDVKIKNKGMTKSTVEHARNPIVLEGFLNVWGNHINEMAMYHGLVLPLEDFSRTLNYSFKADEKLNTDAESVKTALGSAFGESAENYLNELLKAINGGVLHDSSDGFANKMISNFKKSKVMASLSVIVQQPTAIIRAMGIIDPKYFVAQNFHHKTTWEELKKYCPTAIIKETGSFDTNMGRTIVDMVKDDRGFTDKVGDVLGKAPAYMDEVGWNMIWRALKKKVATEQNLSGEELLKECGRQMTLIINETQVYDSVMSRNELMRSKSALTKMATAFMGEPTTVANMIYGAALDIKRGKKGVAGKTIAAVISSVVINGLVSSLVYAFRDDDEEKTFLEKYLSSATTEVIDGFNPLTYIPFVKDAYSLFQGYDVERTDMALIGDVVDAIDDFYNVLDPEAYEGLSRKEIAKHIYENAKPLLTSICDMFGLPVGNILRDAEAIIVNDNLPMSKTSSEGSGLAMREGWLNSSPEFVQKFIDDGKYHKLYLIANNGDSAYVKNEVAEMVAEKFDSYKAEEDSEVKAEKKAKQSVKSSFTATYRDEYKKAFKKKDANEMNRIRKFLYATGLWVSLRELDNLLTKWREEA